jgi:hypothetical protein
MKYLLCFVAASSLLTGAAWAHPGHTAPVDGHSHSLADLVSMSALPALVVIVLVGAALIVAWRRND